MNPKYIGCDLGGTNLRAGIVDFESERVSYLLSTPTLTREGHEAVMARMGALIDDVIAADGVLRITCITAAMYTVNGRKGTWTRTLVPAHKCRREHGFFLHFHPDPCPILAFLKCSFVTVLGITLLEDHTRITHKNAAHAIACINNLVLGILAKHQCFPFVPSARKFFDANPLDALALIT